MAADTQLVPIDVEELLRYIQSEISQESPGNGCDAVRFYLANSPSRSQWHGSPESLSDENFSEDDYLNCHRDVAAAVSRGEFRSGYEHWIKSGKHEGRAFSPVEFSEEEYLALNPEIAEAVRLGHFESGRAHWLACGRLEGRSTRKSMTRFRSRLPQLNLDLEVKVSEIGEPPPSPGTLRARISRRVILIISRMMWWYTRSLKRFGDALNRQAREHANLFERLRNEQQEQRQLILSLQETVTAAVETGLRQFRDELSQQSARLEQVTSEFAAREALAHKLTLFHDELRQLQSLHGGLQSYSQQTRAELAFQTGRISIFLQEVRKRLPDPLDREQVYRLLENGDHDMDLVYVAFENAFRGPRDEIKQRQSIYLPFMSDAHAGTADRPIVDLGCGRGEWLELLRDRDLTARGIDRNRAMLEICRSLNLDVLEADALSYVRSLKDASVGAITSFHLIEHLPFPTLTSLLDEALRVLKPGGLLVLETPNPGNVLVGSQTFYLDPTHLKPLPMAMLRFFIEARGFCKSRVLELHPYPPALVPPVPPGDQAASRLSELFYGAQDYAVIAERP